MEFVDNKKFLIIGFKILSLFCVVTFITSFVASEQILFLFKYS